MGLLKKINRAARRENEYARQWMAHLTKQRALKEKIQLLNIADLAKDVKNETESEGAI